MAFSPSLRRVFCTLPESASQAGRPLPSRGASLARSVSLSLSAQRPCGESPPWTPPAPRRLPFCPHPYLKTFPPAHSVSSTPPHCNNSNPSPPAHISAPRSFRGRRAGGRAGRRHRFPPPPPPPGSASHHFLSYPVSQILPPPPRSPIIIIKLLRMQSLPCTSWHNGPPLQAPTDAPNFLIAPQGLSPGIPPLTECRL